MDHQDSHLHAGFRCAAFATFREFRKLDWRYTLIVAATLGLQACALGPRQRTSPSAVIIEESTAESTPAVTKRSAAAHLEGHAFAVANDDSVVGSIGTIEMRDGDTLSDVARHFGLGYEEIAAANPALDPWVIGDRTAVLVPLSFVLPKAPHRGIVINVAAMRLFHFPGSGAQVVTYPVGIGKEGRSTPTGAMAIAQKRQHPTWRPTPNILSDHLKRGDPLPAVVPPGPDNPLGDYAMYLTAPRYLIHGTNKPYSIGLRASNGCIRMYPENVERLFPAVSVKEPVTIVNQPYLIGSKGDVFYLQAYHPHEEVNEAAAKQRIRSELKALEAARNQAFDWPKIDRILAEARGIPFPVSSAMPSIDSVLSDAIPLAHPGRFFGQPELPPEDPNGWHVFAAETASEMSARRMAGIMNHQGPAIPARVMEVGERYRVVAGPFPDAKAAQKAAKRLQADLELESRVLAPETELAGTALPPLAAPAVSEPPSVPPPEVSIPETPEPEVATPEVFAPETTFPREQAPSEVVNPVESVPYETSPAMSLPEPIIQEAPAPETNVQELPPPEMSDSVLTTPPVATEPATETPNRNAEPLDLTVPEQFADPNAPESSAPLETPPDMEPTLPRSTRTEP